MILGSPDCFILAAEKGRAGQAYIAEDEYYYTLNDLVRLVGRSLGVDVKLRLSAFALANLYLLRKRLLPRGATCAL